MSISLSIGTRLPAAYTSMGRVLLAQLPDAERTAYLERVALSRHTKHSITDKTTLEARLVEIRKQGYCIVDQELDSGLRSLAIPAFDANGGLLGAINISTNAARIDMQTLTKDFLPLLREKAKLIAQQVN